MPTMLISQTPTILEMILLHAPQTLLPRIILIDRHTDNFVAFRSGIPTAVAREITTSESISDTEIVEMEYVYSLNRIYLPQSDSNSEPQPSIFTSLIQRLERFRARFH